ncbi:MAG: 4Fe-4S binding protein [Clostridiales bacterium]|nr:MAG: 4Fe-4S binding protein [Clostridiales bacterium]
MWTEKNARVAELCAEECPKNVISLEIEEQKTAVLCKSADKGRTGETLLLGRLYRMQNVREKNCPHGAVTVTNNLASINSDLCTNCGACVKV